MADDASRLREQAAKARESAEHAFRCSEYPRVGKSAYNGLAADLERLADFTEQEPPAKTGNRRADRQAMRAWALERRALLCELESSRMACESHDIGRTIPFGQPILVGHHSERRHRRMIERMHNKDRKRYDAYEKAKEYRRRAEAARRNQAIYSADDDAAERYQRKIDEIERYRDMVKAWNKAARKKGATWESCAKASGFTVEYARAKLRIDLGYADARREREGRTEDVGRVVGFPSYTLSNSGAEIRRCKKRIEEIEWKKQAAAKAESAGEKEIAPGVTVTTNAELLKLEIWFPGKPSEEVRTLVKSWGFRWVRSVGCWSRNMGPNADACVKALAELLNKQESEAA